MWCESDSIAGVLTEETWKYDVPLMSSRGFSSQTFLYSAAQTIKQVGKPTHIYYVGDWDPAGKLIPEKIEASIRRHAPNAEVYFKRIMITPEQIVEHNLPTRPAKQSTLSRNWAGGTVEAEAMPAGQTRRILREAIERHIDPRSLDQLKLVEDEERGHLERLAELAADDPTIWNNLDVV